MHFIRMLWAYFFGPAKLHTLRCGCRYNAWMRSYVDCATCKAPSRHEIQTARRVKQQAIADMAILTRSYLTETNSEYRQMDISALIYLQELRDGMVEPIYLTQPIY